MNQYRDTYATVNLTNIKDNIAFIHKTCHKPMMAIVKANAYGHGFEAVAKICEEIPYVYMFGVATLGEGVALRESQIHKDILVLGAVRPQDIEVAIANDISINVYSMAQVNQLTSMPLTKILKVHIKLDTGMNRIGLKGSQMFEEALSILAQNPMIQIDGVFTHYGAADEANDTYDQQFALFQSIVKDHHFKYIHAANSAGALYHHEDFTNMVRSGIAIYGLEHSGSSHESLKKAMALKTHIVMTKPIKKGESVGYGFTYTAAQDEWIATVPIGYADGIIRKNQGRFVYIKGKYYQIVGRVCMDQMMIRVDETIQVGDEVEIFGEHISLNDMAEELGTISDEIICLLSNRVPRIYIGNEHEKGD